MSMKYNSLHEYLDDVFKGKQASRAEIKEAKREYWKLWYRHYRKEERERKREFTLRLHPEEIQQMDEKRGELSYSQFLYKAVRQAIISTKEPQYDPKAFGHIKQLLMEVINLLEELINEGGGELTEEIITKMEKLHEDFQLFNIDVER